MLNRFRNVYDTQEYEIICVDLLYQKNKVNIYFEKLYLLMNSMNDWDIDNDSVKVIVNFLFDLFREECLKSRKERLSYLKGNYNITIGCGKSIDKIMKLKYNDLYIIRYVYDPESKGRLFGNKKLVAKCLQKGKEVERTWNLEGFLTPPGDHNFGLIHMIFDKECTGYQQYVR